MGGHGRTDGECGPLRTQSAEVEAPEVENAASCAYSDVNGPAPWLPHHAADDVHGSATNVADHHRAAEHVDAAAAWRAGTAAWLRTKRAAASSSHLQVGDSLSATPV